MERVISHLSISSYCSVREEQIILLMGLFTVAGRLSGGIGGSKKQFDLTKTSVVSGPIARLLWHINLAPLIPLATSLSSCPLSVPSAVWSWACSVTRDRWWLCGS